MPIGAGLTKVGGAVGGIGKTIGSLFGLFFLKWRVTITLIFIIFNLSGAIGDSIKEKNLSPIIFSVGGRIFSGDETQYWAVKEVENNGWKLPSDNIDPDEEDGFWKDVKSSFTKFGFAFNFLGNIWYVYIVWYVFFIIIDKFNTSGKVFSALFAILLLFGVQAIYGVSMLYLHYDCSKGLTETEQYKEVGLALTPLKGTYYTMYELFVTQNLYNAFKESAVTPIEKIPLINESINISSF